MNIPQAHYYPYPPEQVLHSMDEAPFPVSLAYPFPYEMQQDPVANLQLKVRKVKTNKGDIKNFLPKTLQSEKQAQEEGSSSSSRSPSEAKVMNFPMPYQYVQGTPLPKLQSDLIAGSAIENIAVDAYQVQKQKGNSQQTKKPKKEHINTGHWSTEEHSTYIKFLEQYESIMTSSMMKKTSKIFKQMSELIGSRTPSQCRSHHQKFNPYALRGENGKRLPRTERSRAGRKKKNQSLELPKEENIQMQLPYQDFEFQDPYYLMMCQSQPMFYFPQKQFNMDPQGGWGFTGPQEFDMNSHIKKEEDYNEIIQSQMPIMQPTQEQYDEYCKYASSLQMHQGKQYMMMANPQDYFIDGKNNCQNDLMS